MSIKLIGLDLDGTLVDDTHVNVSDRNIKALKECRKRGIHIVLVSGRSVSLMRDIAKKLGCVKYIISANGGLVYNYEEEKPIWKCTINPEDGEKILKTINKYYLPLEVYSDGEMYVDKNKWNFDSYDKQPSSFIEARAKTNVVTEDLEKTLKGREIEKFNIDNIPRDEAMNLLEELSDLKDKLSVNYIELYDNLEISNKDANKGKALKKLSLLLGIDSKEVMVFGDSDNDESMLLWAGESFAMENGEDIAKKSAKHITLSNTMDGVAVAIEEHLLNKQ